MRKLVATLLLSAVLTTLAPAPAQAAGWSNGAWGWSSVEWWNDLGYNGEVFFFAGKAAYADGSWKKCTAAALRYYAGYSGNRDTGWVWAAKQLNYPNFYRATYSYRDDFSWDPGYKTVFSKTFRLVYA